MAQAHADTAGTTSASLKPALVMGLASSFTLIDLFAPQAITPTLGGAFHQTPQVTGIAVNAAVIGMAISGLLSSLFADRLDRKAVIVGSLLVLGIPTILIGYTSTLPVFAGLRMVQGCTMAAGFAVAIAYVAEQWGSTGEAPTVMAGYVTGNIAGQILGRILMGFLAQYLDWHRAFLILGALNLLGGCLLWTLLPRSRRRREPHTGSPFLPLATHLRDARLLGCFFVGFLILVCFVGAFTYSGFDLTIRFGLSPSMLGIAYTVFALGLTSTPVAGLAIRHCTHRIALLIGSVTTAGGMLMTMVNDLAVVLAGLALASAGLFFCQAVATAFTGHSAARFKAAAGGLYLASYYTGGIAGAAWIGSVYANWGWPGSAYIIAAFSLIMAATATLAWNVPQADLGASGDNGAATIHLIR